MVSQVKYIGYTGQYFGLSESGQVVSGDNTFSSSTNFNSLTVTGNISVPTPTLSAHAVNLGYAELSFAKKSAAATALETLPGAWSTAKFKNGQPITYVTISSFGESLLGLADAAALKTNINAAVKDEANIFTQTNTFPTIKITDAETADGRIGKNLSVGDGLTITGIKPDANTTRRVTIDGDLIVKGNVKSADAGIPVDIWTASNDGPNSGLNADLLDGYHAQYFIDAINNKDLSQYYRISDSSVVTSGSLQLNNRLTVTGSTPKINLAPTDTTKYSAAIELSSTDLTVKKHKNDIEEKFGTYSLMNLNLGTGNVTFAGDVVAFSDNRLKDEIVTLSANRGIDIINSLRVTDFIWKDSGKSDVGLIAQELEQILPNLVDSTDEYKKVAYIKLIPYLIAAVQDLYDRINK